MRFASALVAGAFASQAAAFLVPPEISKVAEEAKAGLASILSPKVHTIDLTCPGCPFAGIGEDSKPWQEGVDNKIRLQFDIGSEQSLRLNGLPIYPVDPNSGHPAALFAPQIREEDDAQTLPVPLDFALECLEPVKSQEEPDKQVVPLRFTVLALNGHAVKVDTIAIDLVQAGDKTQIARISNIAFKDTPGASTCNTTSKWSLCRIRAIITARLRALLEAAKAHAQATKGWVKGGCKGGKPDQSGQSHGHHAHGKGPHHHKGHHGAHRLGHMLHQALRFFVIPALLGIIGGLMASAVGMLVGQMIVYLWVRFHRNGQRSNTRIVEIVVEEDEQDALMDEELPPSYKDVEAVAVKEEKH